MSQHDSVPANTATPTPIRLVPLLSLDQDYQLSLRHIRNEPNVRRWMYTDHLVSEDEHINWVRQIAQHDSHLVFAVLGTDHTLLGAVSANAIDRLHRKSDWAFYLTQSARGGLGAAIEAAFIDFVFDELGVFKLNCEVIEGNDAVIKLHKKFLFSDEGFRRSNIVKVGSRTGVHLLGLTKDDWVAGKPGVYSKYKFVFDRFNVSIQWPPPPVAVTSRE